MNQYIVLYYKRDVLQMESFPNFYAAALWVKKHGGYILKEVLVTEVKEDG